MGEWQNEREAEGATEADNTNTFAGECRYTSEKGKGGRNMQASLVAEIF